jgi:hypothetical protein
MKVIDTTTTPSTQAQNDVPEINNLCVIIRDDDDDLIDARGSITT